MTEPIQDVKPVADVQATPVSTEPSKTAQPTPVAAAPTGEPSKDVKQVPLPALQEERGKRQALESEVADLRRMVSQQQVSHAPVQQQPQVDPKAELEELWDEDPKKAVRMEIMYAMDWRDRMETGLESQAEALARKYPDFANFRSTALNQVRSLPLNQRGGKDILEAAYFMVRGQNADTILQQRETELLEKYRRGEIDAAGLSTPPGSFTAPAADPTAQISEEQLRVANAMGLSADDYMSAVVNK